jgi:hypothetical protein
MIYCPVSNGPAMHANIIFQMHAGVNHHSSLSRFARVAKRAA